MFGPERLGSLQQGLCPTAPARGMQTPGVNTGLPAPELAPVPVTDGAHHLPEAGLLFWHKNPLSTPVWGRGAAHTHVPQVPTALSTPEGLPWITRSPWKAQLLIRVISSSVHLEGKKKTQNHPKQRTRSDRETHGEHSTPRNRSGSARCAPSPIHTSQHCVTTLCPEILLTDMQDSEFTRR